jgi:hypothetical protein
LGIWLGQPGPERTGKKAESEEVVIVFLFSEQLYLSRAIFGGAGASGTIAEYRDIPSRARYHETGKGIVSDSAGPLERDAGGVLWRRTLSQIPSQFGRIAWLASLRNPNTGVYEHHGMAVIFGKELSNKALRLSHLACCRDWVKTSLEEQMADLRLYLASQPGQASEVIGNWRELGFWRNILPTSFRGAERVLYLAEVGILLTLLQHENGASDLHRDA